MRTTDGCRESRRRAVPRRARETSDATAVPNTQQHLQRQPASSDVCAHDCDTCVELGSRRQVARPTGASVARDLEREGARLRWTEPRARVPLRSSGATLNLESPGSPIRCGLRRKREFSALGQAPRNLAHHRSRDLCRRLLACSLSRAASRAPPAACPRSSARTLVLLAIRRPRRRRRAAAATAAARRLLADGARGRAAFSAVGRSVRELLEVSGGVDFVLGADILSSEETLPALCDTIRDRCEAAAFGGGAPACCWRTRRTGRREFHTLNKGPRPRRLRPRPRLQPFEPDVDVAPNVALYARVHLD